MAKPEPENAPYRKMMDDAQIHRAAVTASTMAEPITSHRGGWLASRTVIAKGEEKGSQDAITMRGESGARMERGITNVHTDNRIMAGVMRVCASCMDSETAPIDRNTAP